MKPEAIQDGAAMRQPSRRKPRHIAEKIESYIGVGMVVIGSGLLAVLIYAFMQTGTGAPAWMH